MEEVFTKFYCNFEVAHDSGKTFPYLRKVLGKEIVRNIGNEKVLKNNRNGFISMFIATERSV